mgnify:CR=1 FL=1|jgi:uncharacterized protein Usg
MANFDMTDAYSDANLETFGAYRLMTAEIEFGGGADGKQVITWRDYDVTPGFPRLRAFVDRWRGDNCLSVRSVTVTEIEEAAMPACRISPPSAAIH